MATLSKSLTLLSFKPLGKEDLEYIRIIRNKNKNAFLNNRTIGPTHHAKWYKSYKLNCCDVIFVVKDYYADERVGMLSIYDLNMVDQTCKIGRFIVEEEVRDGGIGSQMTKFAIEFAERVFKVHRILLEVKARNEIAHHIYKSSGFHEVRRARGIIYMERQVSWR